MESLLSAMQSFVGSTAASGSQPLDGDSISSSTSCSNTTLGTPASTTLGSREGPTFATDSVATVSPNQNPIFLSHHCSLSTPAPSPNQADERLDFFRSRMLPSFPFIDLTPDMTSRYLRQNRPFLFQAIHTVTTFSTQERLTQVEELKRLLFTSALLKVQSNIDLLLGLLTYLAWSTDPFLGRADLVSRLMMLAMSLVYDLRLFKPSSPDVQIMMAITQGRADEHIDGTPYGLLERQRAVLACFILSSNISSHLGRQDAIRWTPQMEEALRVITISKSCPADRLFASQVRLQLLKQRADDVRQQDEARTGTAPAAASAPRLLYLKTLRRELHELRSSFPPDLHQIDLSGRMGNGGTLLGFERLECLWQSVENIKSWLDNFYRIPCSKLVGQPFHFWSQMILTITLLKYLSTLQDPEWDCQAVRNTVHLISTMDCMLQKLDLSSKEPELQCNDHFLKFLSKLLTRYRLWAEARWDVASQIHDVETRPGQSPIPDLDQMVWMQSMDLGDDQWFESVLGMPTTLY
ncbi:uncharacterized protein CDV56_105380 [Aspergillus thermomutatus]|uniref:Transcription factor domain-containing protein n=1 Tax=Aspergillus thermomutatus TaxID=41047 RepID=A0A397GIC1_ASPTH|nr:uncharacterized protein CDV56_105380 [Aspergillus thermomutatus]RHZ48793.1 hypothetical protein CDV56_105380 [Aspergillus thermomutatus]